MFDNKIAFFQKKVKNKLEAFKIMSDALQKEGFVEESFFDGLNKREEEYPTGLQTSSYGVAIPHTDALHVKKPQIAFMSLENPVEFESMEGGAKVPVSIIIMLAIKEPHAQIEMLQKIVTIFQSKDKMESLFKAEKVETVEKIFSEIGIN